MGKIILNDAGIFLGERDLRGDMNALGLEYTAELQDATTFASGGWHERLDGVKSISFRLAGLFDETVDDFLHQKLTIAAPVTLTPAAPAPGARCFVFDGVTSSYSPRGEIGSAFSFEVQGTAAEDGVGQGAIEFSGTASASGASGGQNITLGAVGDRLLVAVHVLDIEAGASLDIDIESDAAADFATPTVQASSATYTAPGSEILRIDGPVSDTWWRASYTLAGAASFVVAFGKR